MKIGVVTIGQSPRSRVIAEMRDILDRVEIVEKGCLDDLTNRQIESLKPKEREPFLVTVLREGSSVKISRKKTVNLLQKCIEELEAEDVTSIALLCTGDFPNLKLKKRIIKPGKVIRGLIRGILTREEKLGVLIPCSGQLKQIKEKWGHLNPVVAAASPYGNPKKIQEVAKKLEAEKVDLTVLNCIGFTTEMKRKVEEITGKPVILARTVLARVIVELC